MHVTVFRARLGNRGVAAVHPPTKGIIGAGPSEASEKAPTMPVEVMPAKYWHVIVTPDVKAG